MKDFCAIESWVQAVVWARTQFGEVPEVKNCNQTGYVPPPWGPVMVPTGHMFLCHPMKDFCIIKSWVQAVVWARTQFGDGSRGQKS